MERKLRNPLYSNMTDDSLLAIIKKRKADMFSILPTLKLNSKLSHSDNMTIKTYSHALWELSNRNWWFNNNYEDMSFFIDILEKEVKNFDNLVILPIDEGMTGFECVKFYIFNSGKLTKISSHQNF